jgi:AcrR family transcriptional regulator
MSDPQADQSSTRGAILDAALAELVEGGAGVRMERIAGRAGVSRATLYYRFHGREPLLTALVDRTLDEQADAVAEAAASGDPLAVLAAVLDFYCAHTDRCRFLFTHLLSAPQSVEPLMRRQQRGVIAPLADCLREHAVADAELVAEALLGQVNGVVFGRLAAGEGLDRDRLAPVLDLAARVVGR